MIISITWYIHIYTNTIWYAIFLIIESQSPRDLNKLQWIVIQNSDTVVHNERHLCKFIHWLTVSNWFKMNHSHVCINCATSLEQYFHLTGIIIKGLEFLLCFYCNVTILYMCFFIYITCPQLGLVCNIQIMISLHMLKGLLSEFNRNDNHRQTMRNKDKRWYIQKTKVVPKFGNSYCLIWTWP